MHVAWVEGCDLVRWGGTWCLQGSGTVREGGGADRVVGLLRVGWEVVGMVGCERVEVRWRFEGG